MSDKSVRVLPDIWQAHIHTYCLYGQKYMCEHIQTLTHFTACATPSTAGVSSVRRPVQLSDYCLSLSSLHLSHHKPSCPTASIPWCQHYKHVFCHATPHSPAQSWPLLQIAIPVQPIEILISAPEFCDGDPRLPWLNQSHLDLPEQWVTSPSLPDNSNELPTWGRRTPTLTLVNELS